MKNVKLNLEIDKKELREKLEIIDPVYDTGEQIIEKITPLHNSLDFRVLKNIPDFVLQKDVGQGGGGGSIINFQNSAGGTISQYVTAVKFGTGLSTSYIGGVITVTADISGIQTPWLSNIDADGFNLYDLGQIDFRNEAILRSTFTYIGPTTPDPVIGLNDVTLTGVYIGGIPASYRYTITHTNLAILYVDTTAGFTVGDTVRGIDTGTPTGTIVFIQSAFGNIIYVSPTDDWSHDSGVEVTAGASPGSQAFFTKPAINSDVGDFTDGTTTYEYVPLSATNGPDAQIEGIYPVASAELGHTIGDSWIASTTDSLGRVFEGDAAGLAYAIGDVEVLGLGTQLKMSQKNGRSNFSFQDLNNEYMSLSSFTGEYTFGPTSGIYIKLDTTTNALILDPNGANVFVPSLITSGPNGFVGYDGSNGRLFTRETAMGSGSPVGGYGTGVLYAESGTLIYEPDFNYVTDTRFQVGDGSSNFYINADFINSRMTLAEPGGASVQLDTGAFIMKGTTIQIGTSGGDNLISASTATGEITFGDIPVIGAGGTLYIAGQAGTATSTNLEWTFIQGTLGNAIHTLKSTASGDDPSETTYQNKVTTTNATTTTIATIVIPASTTIGIEARVVARRTGGSAGTAEDGAFYIIAAAYKNIGGTATEIGETSISSIEDQAAWSVSVSGSLGNALIQVTGDTNNNVSWFVTYRIYQAKV